MTLPIILKDAFQFFQLNQRLITIVCLPIIAAVAGAGNLIQQSLPDNALLWQKALPQLPGLIGQPAYTGALILLMNDQALGVFPDAANLIRRSMQLWPRLFALHLLARLLVALGLFTFILPGIWLMVRLSFADILVVARNQTPLDAIRGSFLCTGRYFWLILQCVLLALIPIFGLNALLAVFVPPGAGTFVPYTIFETAIAFATLWVDIAVFRIFMDAHCMEADA